jgi:hypothetical protein
MIQIIQKILLSTTVYLIFFGANQTQAQGFFIEPYWGQEKSDFEQGSAAYATTGDYFGLRLGGLTHPFIFGFDVNRADLSVNASDDDKLKTHDLAFFVGYKRDPFRIWMSYLFDNEAESQNAGGTYSGEGGYKVGFSLQVYNTLNLNFEKILRVYKDLDGSSLSSNIEVDGYYYSISWPFYF